MSHKYTVIKLYFTETLCKLAVAQFTGKAHININVYIFEICSLIWDRFQINLTGIK